MGKLSAVNSTDILDAIRLGCQAMSNVFNADDNNVPFFGVEVLPQARMYFYPQYSEAHVPGRHLNALLNARNAANVNVDEQAIENHAKAVFYSYGGPLPLPLNRNKIDGPLVNFDPHNLREGFHALYALAHYCNDERALTLADESVKVIGQLWSPETGWDYDYLEKKQGLKVMKNGTFITGIARSIGPLVKIYRTSGMESALALATALKEKAVNEIFKEDGNYDCHIFGTHTHSTTCVLSSLAQLAELTSDSQLMERVRAFYDHGLWSIRDALGWVIEMSNDEVNPDKGEINNTGDIVETALILGREGHPQYYEDAECILRGHLLPSQLRDTSFIKEPVNPENEDGKREIARRLRGAFGFPAPYGHQPIDLDLVKFNLDIVGGGVASLCEAYREIVRSDEEGHRINMLFDFEDNHVAIQSPYTHDHLRIKTKRPGPIFVRIPSWLDHDSVTVDGNDISPQIKNGYLEINQPRLNDWIKIKFNLPQRELILEHACRNIHVRLHGDAVVAMENFGADHTFFDPY
jgi:hypothetical protein